MEDPHPDDAAGHPHRETEMWSSQWLREQFERLLDTEEHTHCIAGVLEVIGKKLPPVGCLCQLAKQALARSLEDCPCPASPSAVARIQMQTVVDRATSSTLEETATVFKFGIVARDELTAQSLQARLDDEIKSNGRKRLFAELAALLDTDAPSCKLSALRLAQDSAIPPPEHTTRLHSQAKGAAQTIPHLPCAEELSPTARSLAIPHLPCAEELSPTARSLAIPHLPCAEELSPTARNLAANPELRLRVMAGAIPRSHLIAGSLDTSASPVQKAGNSPTARNLTQDPRLSEQVLAGKLPRIESLSPATGDGEPGADLQ
eukprot:gnl/TRDRNA2_/TRDRNA2_171214_c0_seq1.p1 gnl/TRDRNA2_/TRDRNA2_171214_c0~~gnl/TRDRNA2_/TRDRNA2_171214_c0_seq1.p1  ORF type:complete len:332 (+),score=36.41 gnl/TRDRNA2_/TRDRNA2_171214_c0_seq1:44-997(+)